MLRHLAYAAFIAAFATLAGYGIKGWSHPDENRPHATGSTDEQPLKVGTFNYDEMHKLTMMGYPWQRHESTLVVLKRDLPPDPARPTAEDQRKEIEKLGPTLKLSLPEGRLTWPQMLGRLKVGLAPEGVKVMTADPAPPESIAFDVPPNDWYLNESLYYIRELSQRTIVHLITSEGVAIGTDEAVNRLAVDAKLVEVRRRVAPEHADPRLDAEFAPDLVNGSVTAFARAVEGQTGVEVVFDQSYWDSGVALLWRGRPRKLRAALDELTTNRVFRGFWRFHDGRVWILRPSLP